ncbi:ras association domain-containing protein 8-like isoform X2 [Pempheris klunzingeri]
MELKVWVEGVVRVVCGLSLTTSCQDVVIALAQAISRTGRYILILRIRGMERHLVADECPLQYMAQLGQLATEVQFILRWTGPGHLGDGQHAPTQERGFPLPRPSEPEPLKRREPRKAFTFSLGPSTLPKRTKPNRAWSPSPRASPEPRASPVSFLNSLDPSPSSSKEEVFREILQQQKKLQDLEVQLEALERETEVWELERSPATATLPDLTPVSVGELEDLERRLRENEAELMYGEHWEEQSQAEEDRERDMHRRLDQIHSSVDDHNNQIKELQAQSARLEQDLQLRAHRQSSWLPDEALRPLKQELHARLQQSGELDSTLSETQRELQAAEERLQDRWEMTAELSKELRQ